MKQGLIVVLLVLTGCSVAIDGGRYRDLQPAFDLAEFFTGEVTAWGIVQDRSGNLLQRFVVDIKGRRHGDLLVLDESFSYGLGDGVEQRTWNIDLSGGDTLRGEAGDIVGSAEGRQFGNALQWKYQMDLSVDSGSYRVTFDDWMWSFDENTLINRSYIRKFGVVMAEVTIFMRKQ